MAGQHGGPPHAATAQPGRPRYALSGGQPQLQRQSSAGAQPQPGASHSYAMSGTDLVYGPTQCPVLTWCIVRRDVRYWHRNVPTRCPGGREGEEAAGACPQVAYPICLRARAAMSGTDVAYGPTSTVRCAVLA
eukprot:3544860-Rhodomonas_salina.2